MKNKIPLSKQLDLYMFSYHGLILEFLRYASIFLGWLHYTVLYTFVLNHRGLLSIWFSILYTYII
jgi:hypothetical protein